MPARRRLDIADNVAKDRANVRSFGRNHVFVAVLAMCQCLSFCACQLQAALESRFSPPFQSAQYASEGSDSFRLQHHGESSETTACINHAQAKTSEPSGTEMAGLTMSIVSPPPFSLPALPSAPAAPLTRALPAEGARPATCLPLLI